MNVHIVDDYEVEPNDLSAGQVLANGRPLITYGTPYGYGCPSRIAVSLSRLQHKMPHYCLRPRSLYANRELLDFPA